MQRLPKLSLVKPLVQVARFQVRVKHVDVCMHVVFSCDAHVLAATNVSITASCPEEGCTTETPVVLVGEGDMEGKLQAAILQAPFGNIPGVLEVTGVSVDSGDGPAGVVTGDENDDESMGWVAVPVIAGVGLILVALLLVTRRRRSEQDTHFVKHMDDDDDLSAAELTMDTAEEPRALVVGDEETLSSGEMLDGSYLMHDSSTLGGTHAAMDVHICQSSLCSVCEKRRSQVSFIKTTDVPVSPPRLPPDAKREYGAEDTVEL